MTTNNSLIHTDDFPLQLSKLRQSQDVSACAMSHDLGHNRNYINGIESKRYKPSLTEFIEICNYLNVTPNDLFLSSKDQHFSHSISASQLIPLILHLCDQLTPSQIDHLYFFLKDMLHTN
ncbi:MAG: helix-turn-helix domain-containing protein [Lachnospiraceae bacterium]|nr:helix-turn-helix domain-containing protein [Lachnospiraceae bacterium]